MIIISCLKKDVMWFGTHTSKMMRVDWCEKCVKREITVTIYMQYEDKSFKG